MYPTVSKCCSIRVNSFVIMAVYIVGVGSVCSGFVFFSDSWVKSINPMLSSLHRFACCARHAALCN